MSRSAASRQKLSGAYYTPDDVVRSLVSWAVRAPDDRMLDPSCGDGRFLAAHANSVGVEQEAESARAAVQAASSALVHEGDFFTWAAATHERFECAAGNPPFIRYQSFKGEVRQRAVALCRKLGAEFNGLASSWAPFLVAVTSLLKPGGRMAFVVPAEIGHAPYAAPVLEHLVGRFSRVQLVAVRDKLFPDLSEDCWLLYADGFGGRTSEIALTVADRFSPNPSPPRATSRIVVSEWRDVWRRRLRPYLLPKAVRELYREASGDAESFRLSEAADAGIGYVSGANDFFHLRPSEAVRWGIPDALLLPSVRNGRALAAGPLTAASVAGWRKADEPVLLLRLPKSPRVPAGVRRYLDSGAGRLAREAYKCRVRDPWWSVPDVKVPDYFLSYMSGVTPSLVKNAAGATCTNSVHAVRAVDPAKMARAAALWSSPFVQLSCELEGHPLGGGMLKLEPREAGRVLLPSKRVQAELSPAVVAAALTTMRAWRHFA